MTAKTWHTVNGTLFGFPALPTPEEMGEELHAKFTAANQAILDAAAAVKSRRPVKPRQWRGPKPGTGEFTPKPGEPGWSVSVTVHVFEYGKNVYATYPLFEETRPGCVMFPAPGPGNVWVSLWDGQQPVRVRLDGDKTTGTASMELAEYERRFGPRDDFPCCAEGAGGAA